MIVLTTPAEIQRWRSQTRGESVGLVPTMGALHAGHAALISRARVENKHVVVSIYVNPTQFNDAEDLQKYPRPLEKDLQLAEEAGTDLVWTPTYDGLYPDRYRYKVTEAEVSKILEGEFRPGHFDGMLSIVLKLLNAVSPTRAYFGEKDYQQLALVKDMAKAFLLPTEIVAVPTLRENDGLAMSSRNARLTPEERQLAPQIYRALTEVVDATDAERLLNGLGFRVEYLKDWNGRRLLAAWLGNVRLIDNVEL